MDINGMLIWAAVFVSLVVLIVLLVKSYSSWGLTHTILLSLLFIECWTFMFLSSFVSYQRIAYVKAMDKATKKNLDELAKLDEAMYGSRIDPNLDLQKFVPLSNELNRITLERGRVWRNARRQTVGANGATLELPAAVSNLPVPAPAGAVAAGAGAAANPAPVAAEPVNNGLNDQSVVYLFAEAPSPAGLVPKVYLGEFLVTESKDRIVTVRPTAPLNPVQEAAYLSNTFESWAVYELIPLDSHTAFAAESSKREDDAIFGLMKREELASLLGVDPALADALPSELDVAESRKAMLLQSYLRDGGPVPAQAPPESIWYRVKFIKEFLVDDIDVRSQDKDPNKPAITGNALEGGYFNSNGRTIDVRLFRDSSEPVRFKVGDSYVFDPVTANKLVEDGVVEKGLTPVFIRPLNDYEFGFRETRRLTINAQQELLLITRELNEAIQTHEVILQQERFWEQERIQLKSDLGQTQKELEVITSEAESLEKQVAAKKAELSQLYADIVDLHGKVVKRNQELSNAVFANDVK